MLRLEMMLLGSLNGFTRTAGWRAPAGSLVLRQDSAYALLQVPVERIAAVADLRKQPAERPAQTPIRVSTRS
jgi:hypothetical protein